MHRLPHLVGPMLGRLRGAVDVFAQLAGRPVEEVSSTELLAAHSAITAATADLDFAIKSVDSLVGAAAVLLLLTGAAFCRVHHA